MNKIIFNLFALDIGKMSATDWMGLIITVLLAVAMVAAYVYSFSPRNKEKFSRIGALIVNDEPKPNQEGVRHG